MATGYRYVELYFCSKTKTVLFSLTKDLIGGN